MYLTSPTFTLRAKVGLNYLKLPPFFCVLATVALKLLLVSVCFAAGLKEELSQRLAAVLKSKPGGDVSISVSDLQSGEALFDYNGELQLKPASVLKLLTSAVAFSQLGSEHRFFTRVYAAQKVRSGHVSKLYVKGGGDPSLTVEDAWNIARQLKLKGISSIDALAFDDTDFNTDKQRQGQRAYQTGASALSFNFNSLTFRICPAELGHAAIVGIDPAEARVTLTGEIKTVKGAAAHPAVEELTGSAAQMRYRISGSIGAQAECAAIFRSVANPARYFAETFSALLKDQGIKVGEVMTFEPTPETAPLLYQHASKPLADIIKDLNHFSNNFIAEQIVYELSRGERGQADRNFGLIVMKDYLARMGFVPGSFALFDASGLSHENRLTARILVQILLSAYRNQEWGSEFVSSLSIGSRSGTLKKREFDLRGSVLRGKTGSLDGVSSLAGYLISPHGKGVAFAILINSAASKDKALDFEAQLVDAIARTINLG